MCTSLRRVVLSRFPFVGVIISFKPLSRNLRMSKNSIIVADEILLTLPRSVTWDKLNDPEVLALCIRGCSAVKKEGNNFKAVITAKLSNYQKDFNINLTVNDEHAPQAYQLSSKVSAGWFGAASAVSEVELFCCGEANSQTRLEYQATIEASGLIAKALPLVRDVAEKRVIEFFELFKQVASAAEV